jgi:hypothetical protein
LFLGGYRRCIHHSSWCSSRRGIVGWYNGGGTSSGLVDGLLAFLAAGSVVASQHVEHGRIGIVTGGLARAVSTGVAHRIDAKTVVQQYFRVGVLLVVVAVAERAVFVVIWWELAPVARSADPW